MEPQILDTRARRKRYGGRQPKGTKVKCVQSYVDGFFVPLQRHGVLGSNYLFEFRKLITGRSDWHTCQDILTNLYNEESVKYGFHFLDRPDEQKHVTGADWQYLSYILDTAAYRALKTAGKRYHYAQQADKGWFLHQRATGAVTGSMDLVTLKIEGLKYGDQEEILTHVYCPEATRKLARPIELILPSKEIYHAETGKKVRVKQTIIPDQLSKITYPSNIKFFAPEIDMATEDFGTIREKMRRWIYVLEHEVYRTQWGVPSLLVLWVTTNPWRQQKMMEILASLTKDTKQHLFKHYTQFDGATPAPPILWDILDPWSRVGHSPFDLRY